MLRRIWYYLRLRFSPKVRTEVGNLRRTWWARKDATKYSIVYLVHRSSYRSDFLHLMDQSGVEYYAQEALWGLADLYFTNSDDWEAIAKLIDMSRYEMSKWDIICKDHNPFIKKSKDQLVA